MPAICFYFQVHQPMRVKNYKLFDVGFDHHYFDDTSQSRLNNQKIMNKVGMKCYLPANATFKELLKKHPEFKISFSFSGIFLEQLENHHPEILQSFQDLVKAGLSPDPKHPRVEILSETYYHSLAFLYSKDEFKRQVALHSQKIKKLFGQTPKVFRNTELIYNNQLALELEKMGYLAVLTEGADHILGWRSPNFLYQPVNTQKIKLLLKNYKLSDDIAFRFSSKDWAEFPLTAPKFEQWVSAINGNGEVVNLFMDYETFGEHQWESTGIFDFLKALPAEILAHPDNGFVTVSEAANRFPTRGELDVHNFISWADIERDLSAWRSNPIQYDALSKIYELEAAVLACKDPKLIADWRRLQTSDHFYYMCTKWFNDGDVHKYFNPYESPYEGFIAYMNALQDLRLRLEQGPKKSAKKVVVKKSSSVAKGKSVSLNSPVS